MTNQNKPCACKGWTWAGYAAGPRGENRPACVSCHLAIMGDGYDGQRYFAADMRRMRECSASVYPERREYHQVWCAVVAPPGAWTSSGRLHSA